MSAQTAPAVAPVPVMQPQPIQPVRQPIINSPAQFPMQQQQLPPPVPVAQPEDETEQQKALLMKVLQLTDEQINALPPQSRDQIRQLVRIYIHILCVLFINVYFGIEKSIDNATIINYPFLASS